MENEMASTSVKINERPAKIESVGELEPGTIFTIGGNRAFLRTNFSWLHKILAIELSTGQATGFPPETVVEMAFEAEIQLTPKYAVLKVKK